MARIHDALVAVESIHEEACGYHLDVVRLRELCVADLLTSIESCAFFTTDHGDGDTDWKL